MTMYLRQVCLVAHQLEPAIVELTSVLGIERCHVDPGVGKWGLENTLMAIGTNFLEVVAPIEENTAGGRYLDRRGGDGGYILVCQVDSQTHQDQCRSNAADLDVRVAFQSDRGSYHLMQLHPADLNNAMWEIDWDDRAEIDGVWEPAGGNAWKDHVKSDVTTELTGVELQSDDPQRDAEQWGAIAGITVEQTADSYRLPMANGELRFVPDIDGRGAGLTGVDLTVIDRQQILEAAKAINGYHDDHCVELCGTRFYLHDR
mgnify:FL=1